MAREQTNSRIIKLVISLAAVLAIILPPLHNYVVQDMTLIFLFEIIGLTAAGILVGAAIHPIVFRRTPTQWMFKLPASLLAVGTLFCWLLPVTVDLAAGSRLVDTVRHTTLFLLAGFPIGLVWRLYSQVFRGFVVANLVAMIIMMGWVYVSYPEELCGLFSLEQQQDLGRMLLALGPFSTIFWFLVVLLRRNQSLASEQSSLNY